MTEIYSAADELAAVRQLKKHITVFVTVSVLCFLIIVFDLVFGANLPYASILFVIVNVLGVLTIVFYSVFAFLFIDLKLIRSIKYRRLFKDIKEGLSERGEGAFIRYGEDKEDKDGVECNCFFISVYSEKKQEYFERQVLIDAEKPLPNFNQGDKLVVKTHANILIEYEVTR